MHKYSSGRFTLEVFAETSSINRFRGGVRIVRSLAGRNIESLIACPRTEADERSALAQALDWAERNYPPDTR